MANTKITNPELFNLGDSTSATQLPVMTITERIAMNAPITTPFNIDYLVVAGGGAGGGGGQAGGGGAGGLRTNYGGASLTLNTATAYTVTVGAGGIGTGNGVSGSGSNSVFDYITSTITSAGGGGGAIHNISGADGGSGGGAGTQQTGGSGNTPSTTPSQGNAGGSGGTYNFPYSGGGGGGYVSVGSTGGNVSGNGGTGIAYTAANSITGSALSLAGGGGGGTYSGAAGTATNGGGAGFSGTGTTAYGSPGTPGTDNTGGGGGGTGNYQVGTIGASGGSGVVILRYPTADIASYTATGLTPTETTDGTDTILSFTTVGTGAITFTSSTPTGTISTGEMIFNSDTDKVEYWDGTKWYGITYEVPTDPTDPTGNGGVWAYYPLTANSNDSSGNGRNATNNGVSFSADGGRFTGGNSISPPSGFINFGYTQTCWVKDLSTITAGHRIFSFNGHATPGGYYGFTTSDFYYQNSSSYAFFTNQRSTGGTYYYTSNTINNFISGYNLVVAQFVSGQLVKFSLNGQTLQTGTVSVTSGNPGGPWQTIREIGRGYSNGAYYNVEDSYFRNYRLYDRTLTDAEIMAIYNHGSV